MSEIKQKILIVDDRMENIIAMESILDDIGADLISAESGNQALKILLNEEVSLILLDIQMPGIDGFETAQLIRGSQRTKHIPIIFVSAISKEEQNICRGYEAGAIDFMHKPVNPDVVRRKVMIFLELDCQQRILQMQNGQLRRARENTHNILQNVEEGIFLLDNNGNIKPDYSRALEKILEMDQLGGKNLLSTLKPYISPKIYKDTKSFLGLVFDCAYSEEMYEELNPLDEVEYIYNEKNSVKYLSFKIKRIYAADKIIEIMLTVIDITKSVQLQKEVTKKSEESKKQVELLNILELDSQLLMEFLKQTEIDIPYIKKELKSLNTQKLNHIYQLIHGIKGNAAMLNLHYISEIAHKFEEEIITKNFDILVIKEFGTYFLSILEEIENLLKEIHAVANKINSFHEGFISQNSNPGDLIVKAIENTLKNNNGTAETHIEFDHSSYDSKHFGASDFIFLRDIVVQLTRNTIAHGLREEGKNIKKGKDYTPAISLRSAKQNEKLVLEFEDNGKGLQLEKIREKAIANNACSESDLAKMNEEQLASLIFETGISTSEETNLVAGRGVGMNLIKQKIEEHGGSIKVNSKVGENCRFTLTIPS